MHGITERIASLAIEVSLAPVAAEETGTFDICPPDEQGAADLIDDPRAMPTTPGHASCHPAHQPNRRQATFSSLGEVRFVNTSDVTRRGRLHARSS